MSNKTIIVATDFSLSAWNAACYAVDMAMAIKADILLVHIYSLPVAYSDIPLNITEEEIHIDAEKCISDLKGDLSRRANNRIAIHTETRFGFFYDGLVSIGEKVQPFLIVLGSQGKTAAERILFGNHAVRAMRHLPWPSITVPPKARFDAIKKIGLACDFSDAVDKVTVGKLARIVKEFAASLHILYTSKTREFNPEVIFGSGLLQEWLKPIPTEMQFITSENIDEGILEFVETSHIDLLVIIPLHHDLLDRLTHKSHTKQFVLHSTVPVLAIGQ